MEQQKELDNELHRYYNLLILFEKLTLAVEKEMLDSNQWFSFCAKLAKKHLGHLKSFIFNVTQDLLKLEIDSVQVSSLLDISVLYTNLRIQFDTYSTFYHIFIHEGGWDEKIIRFRLWEMDALLSRQRFQTLKDTKSEAQKDSELKDIQQAYSIISNLDFFKKLSDTQKERLVKTENGNIKYANWKFDKGLLKGKRRDYSWRELALNTGIKKEIYNDMHDFTSMHVHSNYISLLQNEQLTQNDKHAVRMVCLRVSCYLICMFMDDLCNRFMSARTFAESLTENEIKTIRSFLSTGRHEDKVNYFK